jgi:hypothetical protein
MTRVLGSYGMGADSTAVVLRWIDRPELAPCPLAGLTLVTAMTGDEWPVTGYLVTEHIVPRLAEHGIRYVQLARAGPRQSDGVVVLDDSRAPEVVHLGGAYTLSQEMLAAGTVPQYGGCRRCSLKAKGWVIDTWASADLGGEPYLHVMGYEAGEAGRIVKDRRYDTAQRTGVYPLQEWGWTRADCESYIHDVTGVWWPKSACTYCLAGETEIVTRQGVRPIRDLAGGTHELLVPRVGTHGGLAHRGSFRPVQVRLFGQQQLYRVQLRRSRSTKTVLATAEHRWILAPVPGTQWTLPSDLERTTSSLRPGDRLKPLQAAVPTRAKLAAFAVAQGFVYGDGSRLAARNAPAALCVYDNGKDEALLPYFLTCEPQRTGRGWEVYGLPRTWKDLPGLAESRTFLLSWLAGYFAADGTVSRAGVATLYSADRSAIEFARDVAAVCGIGYTPIRSRLRLGNGHEPTPLHQINLTVHDLPEWFFLIAEHAARAKRLRQYPPNRQPWRVVSVEDTGRVEEVFCATVPGAGAFGLAEDLMTGNCPFALATGGGRDRVLAAFAAEPTAGVRALVMERVSVSLNPKQSLGKGWQLHDLLAGTGQHQAVLAGFERDLDRLPWHIFDVRRAFRALEGDASKAANLVRSVTTLAVTTRDRAGDELAAAAAAGGLTVTVQGGVTRAWARHRGATYPTAERCLVACPVTPDGPFDKVGPKFAEAWTAALDADDGTLPIVWAA